MLSKLTFVSICHTQCEDVWRNHGGDIAFWDSSKGALAYIPTHMFVISKLLSN